MDRQAHGVGDGGRPSPVETLDRHAREVALSIALRDIARDLGEGQSVDGADVIELVKVLARAVEGKDVIRAFGAPGDWGYNTPIGRALSL
jgi:hypothetical protein